jgi:methionyl-tRNA formyltransferase
MPPLKALLVTSAVTFVPENYDDLVCGLARCPEIGGLLMLDNRNAIVMPVVKLLAVGGHRLAFRLLCNRFGRSVQRRRAAFAAVRKPVVTLPTINGAQAVNLVKRHGYDLIINARTRFIYKAEILAAPRLGCINVHHGLLPDERGVMCDLWALSEGRPAGFSVHRMAPKVDAGAILERVVVSDGRERDYLRYLARTSRVELELMARLLRRIADEQALTGLPNTPSAALRLRKTPDATEFRSMLRCGLQL